MGCGGEIYLLSLHTVNLSNFRNEKIFNFSRRDVRDACSFRRCPGEK